LIVYLIGNISAKNIKMRSRASKLWQTVYMSRVLISVHCIDSMLCRAWVLCSPRASNPDHATVRHCYRQ